MTNKIKFKALAGFISIGWIGYSLDRCLAKLHCRLLLAIALTLLTPRSFADTSTRSCLPVLSNKPALSAKKDAKSSRISAPQLDLRTEDLYETLRSRLEKPLEQKRIKEFLRKNHVADFRAIYKTTMNKVLAPFGGDWMSYKSYMTGSESSISEKSAFLKFQKGRIKTSDTLKKYGTHSKGFADWQEADRFVDRMVEQGQDITPEGIKALNAWVAKAEQERIADPVLTPGVFNLWLVSSRARDNRSHWNGEFRKIAVSGINEGDSDVAFTRYEYIAAKDIPGAMNDFMTWYQQSEGVLNPVELAALTYRWLISIHPFVDGNGRTVRLVMDWILQRNGYPPMSEYSASALFARSSLQVQEQLEGPEVAIFAVYQALARSAMALPEMQP